MKNSIKTIFRLLTLPFIISILIITCIRLIIIRSIDYIVYGGETILYSKHLNRITILEVFEKLNSKNE